MPWPWRQRILILTEFWDTERTSWAPRHLRDAALYLEHVVRVGGRTRGPNGPTGAQCGDVRKMRELGRAHQQRFGRILDPKSFHPRGSCLDSFLLEKSC